MAIRVSCRRVLRGLVVALVAACPLVAADPPAPRDTLLNPRVQLSPTAPTGPFIPVSFIGPRQATEFPAVPIDHYPRAYSGIAWTPLSEPLAAAKRRNAERVPFELKYLPPPDPDHNGPQIIVAVRPSAIFDRPGGPRLVTQALANTGLIELAKGFFGLGGVNFPSIHAVDMLLVRAKFKAERTDNDTHVTVSGHATGAVIRTRERYDWRRELARNPHLGTASYRGVEYRTTKMNPKLFFPQADDDVSLTGLYVADDYTLVIETEDAIQGLIDRLLDAKPAPEPAGWEKVSRGVCAVSLANVNKAWTSDLPGFSGPRLPKGGDWEWNCLDDVDELLLGLDDQPTTRLFLSANAFDPFAGKRMTWNAKRLLALFAAYVAGEKGPEADEVRAVWEKAIFTQTFRGFQISVDAGRDLISPLLDSFTASKPEPQLPTQSPRSFPAVPSSSGFSYTPGEFQPIPPGEWKLEDGKLLPVLPQVPSTQLPALPPIPGRGEKPSESDLPPIPQPPPTPGFYDRSPLQGLGDPSKRFPGF